MKTIAASFFLALIISSAAFGQAETEKRVIEVSGSAETLITPNEFTFKVTIVERMEKKEKLTIETQEASLRSELSRIGIDPAKDLSVYDISSRYIPQKKVRDVLGSKDYSLKVRDISKIAPLIELIDRLNISKIRSDRHNPYRTDKISPRNEDGSYQGCKRESYVSSWSHW